jgi:hypothetical protein
VGIYDQFIRKALVILEGPDAESILRESLADLADLIELGVLEVDVAYTIERLTAALETPDDITAVGRQFGAYTTSLSIVRVVEERA